MDRIEENKIKKKTSDLLKKLGVNIGSLGYKYWITVVAKVIKNQETGNCKTTMGFYYKYAASKHRTTYFKAEKAMRYIVEENQESIKNYFKDVKCKIRNKEFLQLLCEEVS